jgi:RNA polymerase sigma factor (sigma-70 family)
MATAPVSPLIRYIRRVATAHAAADLSDGLLLERFTRQQDEAAFTALVRRHGPRVMGVCRRVVQDWHTAEDCFQAVFLVLARKAPSLERPGSLVPWLHGVATRVALKAKAQAAKQRVQEQKAAVSETVEGNEEHVWRDLRPVLDEAIAGLTEKYRVPFVLCYLEGRTVAEVARQLGQPQGTVAARLARAREQLRGRLARRGLAPSAAVLAAVLSETASPACVPAPLVTGIVQAAGQVAAGRVAVAGIISERVAALIEGVLRSMMLTKLKAALVVLAAPLLTGGALLGYQVVGAGGPGEHPGPKTQAEQATRKGAFSGNSHKVNVPPGVEAKEQLERVYKALEDEINKAFPDAHVRLSLVCGKLVITGQVKDAIEATQILQILQANAPAAIPAQTAKGGITANTLNGYIIQGEQNIVNLLRIAGDQQVMLKVTVAEVSRAAARFIGLDKSFRNKADLQSLVNNTGTASPNLPTIIDQGRIRRDIEALWTLNLAKSLAEPKVVTMNGRSAGFFAGGAFPVSAVSGATLNGLREVNFVPFGVYLQFVPYVSCNDRIQLELSASVSVRDVTSDGKVGGPAVPGLTTRNIQTTVVLREGETLAIAGLVQNNLGVDTAHVPFLGDLPFPRQLFREDPTSESGSELVLLVTPELVHPTEPKENPPLPQPRMD